MKMHNNQRDALGRTMQTTDPDGFTTTYSYDLRGRLTSTAHPDKGTTTMTYDKAGNLTHKATQKLADQGVDIEYVYDYNRLKEVHYPLLPQNNVTYTYGTASNTGTNACGRLLRVDDGSGYQIFSYDKLGNVSEDIRTFALPFEDSVYNFRMMFEYDSWNRVQRIVYPDSEVVTYNYDLAGQLCRVHTCKATHRDTLIRNILYDEFGHRTQVVFGNGVTTNYTYDVLQRLSLLETQKPGNPALQKILYTFDLEDNITRITNSTAPVNGIGGGYTFDYQYDGLYRLTASTGTFAPNGASYGLEMDFTPAGRVCRKEQEEYNGTKRLLYGYNPNLVPHAARRICDPNSGNLRQMLWDANGNLAQIAEYNYDPATEIATLQDFRNHYWDEEDRLNLVLDNRHFSYYLYGYDGQRVAKFTSDWVFNPSGNGDFATYTDIRNVVLYPYEYLVITQQDYTKYYYAGGMRIAAKWGEGGFSKMMPICAYNQNLRIKANTLFNSVMARIGEDMPQDYSSAPCPNYGTDIAGFRIQLPTLNFEPNFVAVSTNLNRLEYRCHRYDANVYEELFYFHSDHLGSANWITTATASPAQFLLHQPYGEEFVIQWRGSYDERFTFTGKERDAETGYYYHGARFNSSDIGWLSVDPMAEKYPEITPYHYCHWNPIKLIDPTGEFDFYIHQIMVRKAFKNSNSSLTAEQQKLVIKGTGLHSDVTLSKDNTVHMDSYNPQVMIESEIFGCFIETYNNAIQNYGKNINKGEYLDAGVNLHTIADFYSHSNYIELYEEYAKDNKLDLDIDAIPTFSEAQNDEKLMNFLNGRLKSGIFPNDNDKIKESHKGINKDNYLFSKNGHKQYTDKFKSSRYKVARRVAEKEILNLIKRNEEE